MERINVRFFAILFVSKLDESIVQGISRFVVTDDLAAGKRRDSRRKVTPTTATTPLRRVAQPDKTST